MPVQSRFRDLDIPQGNILSYLFPEGEAGSEPLWINAEDPWQSLSAADSLLRIKQLGLGFEQAGISTQRAVMIISPNHIYVPIAFLATSGSNRVFTAANPTYTVDELVYQMRKTDAALILVHPSNLENGVQAARKANIPLKQVFQFADEPVETSGHGVQDWRHLLAAPEDAEHWNWDTLSGKAADETVALINFSSGTTGLPKGVCVTHYNLVANVSQVIHMRLSGTRQSSDPSSDRWLSFLPWYHAYAQMFTILLTCKLRRPVYTMAGFKLEPYLKYIDQYKITSLLSVPPILVMLNKRPEAKKYDLSSVKYMMSAAAPLKRDLQNDLSKQLGAVIVQSWGMTETTCTGMMIPGEAEDQSGSAGYLLPNTEAILVDEKENEVTSGSGELWVRGPQMMKAYWNNEEATRDAKTRDGWLKTGDVAEYNDGKFWIVDRKKELIKVNGLQVAPAELEKLLLGHDAVADAAVVGIMLEDRELPRAYVALHDDAAKSDSQGIMDSIQKFVAERVAKHKKLLGGVVFVETVPRSLSGKILRAVVKGWARDDAQKLEGRVKPKL